MEFTKQISQNRSRNTKVFGVNDGLAKTFKVLQKSRNRSIATLLEESFREGGAEVRRRALEAMVATHRGGVGLSVVERWHELPDSLREKVIEKSSSLSTAIRLGLNSGNLQTIENALSIIEVAHEPMLAPELVRLVEEGRGTIRQRAGQAIVSIVRSLADDKDSGSKRSGPRTFRTIRGQVYECLYKAMERFADHRSEEIAFSFLLLSEPRDELLRRLLRSPRDPAMPVLCRHLSDSEDPLLLSGILVSSVTIANASPALLRIWSHRNDIEFVQAFCHRVGRYPSETIRSNLKRLKSVRWLRGNLSHLADLSATEQIAVLNITRSSQMATSDVFRVVEFLLEHGVLEVQQRATEHLHLIRTPAADRLVARMADHGDPTIQAAIVGQLRERKIPGAMERLMKALESEHAPVRSAAKRCFPDVDIERYLMMFDQMDAEAKVANGALVLKVDPKAIEFIATR